MRREDRRGSFIDAAKVVIGRDGPGVSMEVIARQAGVTKPILYRVFGDRDGLVKALGAEFGTELTQRVNAALAEVDELGDQDPRNVVVAAIDAYVQMIDRDPGLYRFITDRLDRSAPGEIENLTELLSRDIALTLGAALRNQGCDSGAAEPWAYALVGMVHAAGDWWVERRTIPRQQLVEYLVSMCWDGMRAQLGNP